MLFYTNFLFSVIFQAKTAPFSHAPFFLRHTPPQRLREGFCCEMVSKGVSDSYVDSFCGRIPRSILAKHYLDYSPERMRAIYEKANLKVLV